MSIRAPAAERAAAVPDPGMGADSALVPALQEGLERLSAGAAEVFLALGGALQSMGAQARAVAELSKEAAGLGSAGEWAQSLRALEEILAEAIGVRALGQVCRTKLHRVLLHLQQCRAPMDRLLTMPSILKTVGILSRIEAGHLEDASDNISSLTAEMGSATAGIDTQVTAVGEMAAKLAHLIEERTGELDKAEQEERDEEADLVTQINAVLGSFRGRQEAASRAALKIDKEYEGMRQATDKIVMSLQSEDIARQRIEHVQEALRSIAGDVSAGGQPSGCASVLVLQRSQLVSTRDLLSDSIGSLRDSLRSLGPRLNALLAETSSLASQTDEGGRSFMATVRNKVGSLCTIFGPYFNSARKVVATVDSVLPALVEMTNAVRQLEEIQASIRVMALNAGIKTRRLGKRGITIGALAAELHETARQSDGDTRAVLESSDAMQGLLQEMTKQRVTSSSSSLAHWCSKKMKTQMDALIDGVFADGQKLSTVLAVLLEKTAKLRADLESATAVAERASAVIQTFDSMLKELDRDLVRMGYGPNAALAHDGKAANLSALYSMQSERHVHEQLLGGGKAKPKAAGVPQPAADELGSNVELF